MLVLGVVLAVGLVAAGCGGGGGGSATAATRRLAGPGFAARAPQGWGVTRGPRSVAARSGGALVSVTVFPLVRSYRPELFARVVPELDRVAQQLAVREQARVESPRTVEIAGRKSRAYDLVRSGGGDERIAFVLEGRREYQLLCRNAAGACDLLLSSFELR